MKSDPERDPAVLADRIEERAEEYFGECVGHSPDESRPWLVEGTTVPLSALTCQLLNETVMHGYDIAHAAGRTWRIEPTHAAMVMRQFLVPVLQTVDPRTFVSAKKAAGLQATYQLHLRGGERFNFVFNDGSLRVESPLPGGSTAISQPIRQRSSWCSGTARVSGTRSPRVSSWPGVASPGWD